MPQAQRRSLRCLAPLTAAVVAVMTASSAGAVAETADAAIDRAANWLRANAPDFNGGQQSLAAYALLKAGASPDESAVVRAVQGALARASGTTYKPSASSVYEGVVDLLLLEAADADRYQREIQVIATWLLGRQQDNGAWHYAGSMTPAAGDSSQTQYALLGLWAAWRAGIDIPSEVWDKAAGWYIRTQHESGGFIYHPPSGMPSHSMTAAGVGSLALCRLMLHSRGRGAGPSAEAVVDSGPRSDRPHRFLERIGAGRSEEDESDETPRRTVGADPRYSSRTSAKDIDAAIERGVDWLDKNWNVEPSSYPMYYAYGLERMGALAGLEKIGGHDWYREGEEALLRKQRNDGSWPCTSQVGPGTSFGILFLLKATGKLLGNDTRVPRFGGGLLSGGRGLPDNLQQVLVQEGEVKVRREPGSLDELLTRLETSTDAQVPQTQSAIVDVIQLDDPEELIGQRERLVELARDPRIEVRRTALWALGHTGDLRLAPLLIRALEDPDLTVNFDALDALCTLSRRADGLGVPPDPLAELPEDATEAQRQQAIEAWRATAVARWNAWYLKVRPYDERDGLTPLKP